VAMKERRRDVDTAPAGGGLKGLNGKVRVAREVGQGIIVLALTGSTVGGFLGMVAVAAKALGR
jgi:hypothetical protein